MKEDATDHETARFFRAVDRAVMDHHSHPSGLPLLFAALPEHHHRFRAVSRNPFLAPEAIDIHPDDLSLDALRERAWHSSSRIIWSGCATWWKPPGRQRDLGERVLKTGGEVVVVASGRLPTQMGIAATYHSDRSIRA